MTAIIELLTALLEYLDIIHGIVQSAYFCTVNTSLSPQNASMIPDSYTYLLCLKLCWHNRLIPSPGSSQGCSITDDRGAFLKECFHVAS